MAATSGVVAASVERVGHSASTRQRMSVLGTLRKTGVGYAESGILPLADHLNRIDDNAFVP
jgi:hypothetical protein